jgi:hypothetical protein
MLKLPFQLYFFYSPRVIAMVSRRAWVGLLWGVLLSVRPVGETLAQAPPDVPAGASAKPDAGKPEAPKLEDIEQPKPAFYVHAAPDRESRTYYEGEQMTVRVKSEVDAYLYVIYEQADGATYVVFPNSAQPNNRVRAKEEVELPGKNDTFRWTIGAPFGNELMKVIASKERIAELEKPEMRERRFTPVDGKELRAVARELGAKAAADAWSEVTLKITTHAGLNPNSPHFGKRYAVLFAVPEQWVTAPTQAVFEKAPASNLGLGPLYDVILMQRCLMSRGGMDGTLALGEKLVKGDAKPALPTTKENMKRLITEELPALTEPGDTVLIFYSGHGAQFSDPEEKDGLCEFLVPCDVIDVFGLLSLRKLDQALAKDGQSLPDNLKELLARGEGWLREANIEFSAESLQAMNEQARKEFLQNVNDFLIKKSCVTDDEFGHWVQALDGRRVVVVLDACMSGGFADEEGDKPRTDQSGNAPAKSLGQAGGAERGVFRFDFLRGQLGRLKDLGQGNTAMLAAARSSEPSQQAVVFPSEAPAAGWRNDLIKELAKRDQPTKADFMGVFTFYLVNTMLDASGPVDVQAAGAACQRQLEEYFRWRQGKTNQPDKGHAPVFFDHSRPPILLKP